MADQKTFIVTGHAKGGTSMVAGVLQILGIQMNENPNGDPNTMEDKIGRLLGRPDQLKQEIDRKNRAFDLWGFKWPKYIDVLNRYHGSFRNPHYVFVFRDPVANTDRSPNRRMDVVLQSHQAMVDFYGGYGGEVPILLVSYEKALLDPMTFVDRVIDFVGPGADQSKYLRASAYIEPKANYPEINDYADLTVTA